MLFFPQLAIITSHILPTFPPGEPETTHNKGTAFLQIQHFPLIPERAFNRQCVVYFQASKVGAVCVYCLCRYISSSIKELWSLEDLSGKQTHITTAIESLVTSCSGLDNMCLPATTCTTHPVTYCRVSAKARFHFLIVASK